MKDLRICLISFSNNADHQNVIYSMFLAMNNDFDVYTIGIKDPKSLIAPHTDRNFYINCPARPGISKEVFRFSVLKKAVDIIKEYHIDILYFESQHIWNAFFMMLCPRCKKVVAVHDVIPHDGNRAMDLSNYVTCHLADHIVLRNMKYKEELARRDKVPLEKITCIDLWRFFPEEVKPVFSGEFLFFGRIRRYKGFDSLKKIIERTQGIKYRVVGMPDEESKSLVEEIKKLPNATVDDREVSDEEMLELFKNADWLVLPYTEATQSGVITDACCFSRPSIAFDVGAISEQIENGQTGFLVAKGDVDAFAETVLSASQIEEDEYAAFCHRAYEFGRKKYSAESAVPKLFEVFEQLSV